MAVGSYQAFLGEELNMAMVDNAPMKFKLPMSPHSLWSSQNQISGKGLKRSSSNSVGTLENLVVQLIHIAQKKRRWKPGLRAKWAQISQYALLNQSLSSVLRSFGKNVMCPSALSIMVVEQPKLSYWGLWRWCSCCSSTSNLYQALRYMPYMWYMPHMLLDNALLPVASIMLSVAKPMGTDTISTTCLSLQFLLGRFCSLGVWGQWLASGTSAFHVQIFLDPEISISNSTMVCIFLTLCPVK